MEKERVRQLVEPPPELLHDMRYAAGTAADLMRLTGVSERTARKLFQGQPVYKEQLDRAMANFYGGMTGGGLAVQLQAMPPRSRALRQVLRLLRAAADFVWSFRGVLRLCHTTRRYWVFQPRLTLRHLVEVLEECDDLLYRMHRECPKYDKSVFRDHPGMLEEYKEKDRIYGGRRVYYRHVRKVQGSAGGDAKAAGESAAGEDKDS